MFKSYSTLLFIVAAVVVIGMVLSSCTSTGVPYVKGESTRSEPREKHNGCPDCEPPYHPTPVNR